MSAIDKITNLNCKSTTELLQVVQNACNGNTESVLFLTIDISSDFERLEASEQLKEITKNHSIVILVSNEGNNKQTLLWKSKDIHQILTYKHKSDGNAEHDEKIYAFIAEFLTKCLSYGRLGEDVNQHLF